MMKLGMKTNNIFAGGGSRAQFVSLVYSQLMTGKFVTYADILKLYYGRDDDYYTKISYSNENGYGELKKAFPQVVKAIEEKCPGSIIDNGKRGKGNAKKYVGEDNDPLAEERKAVVQKTIEDYVLFCKESAGLLPTSWFSSFFENTQLLLDTTKKQNHICSSLEQNLTNIELLPVFHKAIVNQSVLRFRYKCFWNESFELTFHPQYLKEYNGRWFVFGEADKEPFHAYNVPLDRIIGDVMQIDDVDYVCAEEGFYQKFFSNIVGVSHEKNSKIETVIIKTKTEYQHGLLVTKPLHYSQKELIPFGSNDEDDYGVIELTVEPNRELVGKILVYGQFLEVVEPQSLRNRIVDILKQQLLQYQVS